MCGIAGVADRRGVADAPIATLAACVRHRGPDAVGFYERPMATLAQARLSVIDLVTGDPPITNEDGTIGVAFNGEIYNFEALRAELRAAGHHLATTGDTEVIAHLTEDVDPVQLARRLEGMFAFASWDDNRQRLTLGRDRFGKKPLYYWTDGTRLVFGSEIKALLADPHVPRSLDEDVLAAYLTFGYAPSPRTFFEGIRSVPAGHVLVFDAAAGSLEVRRYWQPPLVGIDGTVHIETSFADAASHVRRLLGEAVGRRMVSDVPLGAFLSGGVDSSTVVALMAERSGSPIETFTIGFEDDEGFDERPFAREVARLFGTTHTEFVVHPDKADVIERLLFHHDQPFGDSSALPTYLLAELTRKHVTVALCGDGGDELFAGYERFSAGVALSRADRLPASLRSAVARIADAPRVRARRDRVGSLGRMLSRSADGMPDAYLAWLAYMPLGWVDRLLPGRRNIALDAYRELWARSANASTLDRLLDLNLRTYLLDDLLPKVDRMAMAHGLEVRSPLLDAALAEFVLRLPPSFKQRGLSRKRVLKAAMADVIPEHLLNRRKRGFGVPLDRWFRTDLASYIDARLGAGSRLRGHVDADGLDALLAEHQRGVANHGHAIWALLTLELFLERESW